MIKQRQDQSLYDNWLRHPVEILNTADDLLKNINLDSPGFVARDYRFYPRLQEVNISKLPTDYRPSPLQIFFAWQRNNEIIAHVRNRQSWKRRWKRVIKIGRRGLTKILNGRKQCLLTEEIVRRSLLNLITIGIGPPDFTDGIDQFTVDITILLGSLNLDPERYRLPVYRRYRDLVVDLVGFIYRDKFDILPPLKRSSTWQFREPINRDGARDALEELLLLERSILKNIDIIIERNEYCD